MDMANADLPGLGYSIHLSKIPDRKLQIRPANGKGF
jgi:hypothetical protein